MLLRHLFEFSIVETPEFQRWFAGSKIVDAQGNPLKLYHGTSKDQDFRKFRVPGNGAWFTSDPKGASDYAEHNDSQGFAWHGNYPVATHTAASVVPVYIRAVNPLRIDELPKQLRHASNYRAAQRHWFNQLRAEGYDALVIDDTVVVLKDSNQIKSAIGNRNFNPTKANMTESL